MANTDTKLGIVAILPVGAWVSASTYEYLNLVTYGGGAYLAVQDVPSGTALSNTDYWMQITEKGLKGDTGAKGDKGDTGDTGNGIASVSVTETSVEGAEHNYTMTVTMTDGTVTTYDYTVTDGAVTSVNGRTGAVIGLAEQDGYYELMSVGSADQLISTQYIEDSVPYKFRTSGGSADIGDREIDEIVGGTVNWNQAINTSAWGVNYTSENGYTITTDADGFTVTVTTDGASNDNGNVKYLDSNAGTYTVGHKYYNVTSDSRFSIYGIALHGSLLKKTPSIFEAQNAQWGNLRVVFSNIPIGTYKFTAVAIDLTAAFGVEIADYIYNLEQNTAGAGVAWFKKLFPNDFYPYSAPTLTHVSGLSSHDMVGFNQWDEQWEVGGISSSTGGNISQERVRSKNYIRLIVGASYSVTNGTGHNITCYWYDDNKNYITSASIGSSQIIPLLPQYPYMRFVVPNQTTYANDICINLSWSGTRNGEYEPFVKHSYPLDFSLTLRGIPKLDADGNLYFDGDVYPSSGEGYHNYALVDLGTLNWAWVERSDIDTGGYFSASLSQRAIGSNNLLCSKYPTSPLQGLTVIVNNYGSSVDKILFTATTGYNVAIIDSAYTDATAFKTAMNGVMLVYPLATPVPFTAQPYTNPQIVNDWGTEEYVSETIVPVGHNTKYPANLRDKLQHLPDLADSDGYYMIQQTGTDMSLIRFRIPQAPTSPDGVYTLQATVSGGNPAYTWVEVQSS